MEDDFHQAFEYMLQKASGIEIMVGKAFLKLRKKIFQKIRLDNMKYHIGYGHKQWGSMVNLCGAKIESFRKTDDQCPVFAWSCRRTAQKSHMQVPSHPRCSHCIDQEVRPGTPVV